MRQFKYLTYIWHQMFPLYYHEKDTYRDSEGKGILQRFINICSEYLDTDIDPYIDNFMDIIDVDKTNPIFLNYLWEFFGYIPYAYGVILKGEPYTKERINEWLSEPRSYPYSDYRNLLKYAISLYKIRCTSRFYEILGRFYNVEFTLIDPGGTSTAPSIGLDAHYDDYQIRYDNEVSKYDGRQDCLKCIDMTATIGIDSEDYNRLVSEGNLEEAKLALISILNKYLPVHVNPFTLSNTQFYIIGDISDYLQDVSGAIISDISGTPIKVQTS